MKFLLVLSIVFSSLSAYGQQRFAGEAYVYRNFSWGGTTAMMSFYSKAVDTMQGVTNTLLAMTSLDTLNFLLSHVRGRRHFQQKLGRGYYASIIKDGQERGIVIFPDWAIIDFARKRQYVFRGTQYAGTYHHFVEKIFPNEKSGG